MISGWIMFLGTGRDRFHWPMQQQWLTHNKNAGPWICSVNSVSELGQKTLQFNCNYTISPFVWTISNSPILHSILTKTTCFAGRPKHKKTSHVFFDFFFCEVVIRSFLFFDNSWWYRNPDLPVPYILGAKGSVTWYIGNWEVGSKYKRNWKISGIFWWIYFLWS